jgi:hypothetical protein
VVSFSNHRADLTVTIRPIPQRAFLEWGFEPRLATRFAILGRKFFCFWTPERSFFFVLVRVVDFFLNSQRSESGDVLSGWLWRFGGGAGGAAAAGQLRTQSLFRPPRSKSPNHHIFDYTNLYPETTITTTCDHTCDQRGPDTVQDCNLHGVLASVATTYGTQRHDHFGSWHLAIASTQSDHKRCGSCPTFGRAHFYPSTKAPVCSCNCIYASGRCNRNCRWSISAAGPFGSATI